MHMSNKQNLIVVFLFLFLSLFIFRDYFLKNQVPLPANLLVAIYQPWASYKWEGYPNGPPSKPIGFDNLRIFYPFRKITIDQIKQLQWPLWNPYSFSGNPLLANYQSAVFHPLSFLFFLMPQIDAWSIIVILQPFLASLFMYLFLREASLNKRAGVFGAIAFGFSGFMIVWMEESFMSVYSSLFLPLILYAIEKILKKISVKNFLILLFGLSGSLLSGWFQMTFYVWTFAAVWVAYRFFTNAKKDKKPILLICAAYVLAFLICAIHLFPGFEAFTYSARGTTDAKFIFDLYLQPISHLVTLIAPDFFGNPASYNYFDTRSFYHEKTIFVGIPVLLFALYQFLHFKNLDKKEKFFKWAWLISLSLGFALPTSWILLYNLKLPFISTILPSRIFFLSTFSIATLSAFGLERYLDKPDKKKLMAASFLLGMVMFLIWIFILNERTNHLSGNFATISFKNFIIPSIISVATIVFLWLGFGKSFRNKAYGAILIISLVSLMYFANKYLYFSDRKLVFPPTPVLDKLQNISGIDRVWTIGDAYMERNLGSYFGLFSPEGYDSLYIRRYGELLYAGQSNGMFSNQIPRTDATLSQPNRYSEITKDMYRKRLLSLLGVRYIVEKNKNEEKNAGDQPIWQDAYFKIYEYKESLPRIFLASDYIVLTDNQKIMDFIFDEKIDLSKIIILEEEPIGFLKKSKSEGTVKLDSYSQNKIIVATHTREDSLLFLSDNYYPGWKAFVDNKEVKIYRADYNFRTIVLPKGKHSVSFKYEPKSFQVSIIVTIFALLISLLICIKMKMKSSK